jgi:hypothetical protein
MPTPGSRMIATARVNRYLAFATCASILAPLPLQAREPIMLTIKDHRFTPERVTAPVGERFQIEVENQDPTPSEFESRDLRVEKIVVGGGKISVMVGPLKPGTYSFFDDYHPDTAVGTLIAVAKD